jgi:NADH-ubiquinone oxidoreductase chain 4L
MTFGLALTGIGAAGFTLTGSSLLGKIFCLEVMLLGVNSALILASLASGSPDGYAHALLVVCVAGAETAIGLSLVVALYSGTAYDTD